MPRRRGCPGVIVDGRLDSRALEGFCGHLRKREVRYAAEASGSEHRVANLGIQDFDEDHGDFLSLVDCRSIGTLSPPPTRWPAMCDCVLPGI